MQTVAESIHEHNHPSGATDALPAGTVIADRYRLDEIIARGGMATVWRGHDLRLGRDVAVKLCPPGAPGASLQIREEHFSSALLHPNVVAIFDAGDIAEPEPGAGNAFIVMEYIKGSTAHQIAPVAWRDAVNIVCQAADGLAAAHERGIVHCDIKPGNLLIDRRGRVLVADFGIAMPVESELGEFVHGSAAYVAPERLTGERADPRVDVYGLGGVLSFLLTGQRPTDDAVSLPLDCPSELSNVIARARSHNPHERYADASAFREAVDRATDAVSVHQKKDSVLTERTKIGSVGASRLRDDVESSRRVISHPTRVRAAHARPMAQQTAAMSPSPVRIARRPDGNRTRHQSEPKRLATRIAAVCVGVLLLLLIGTVLREIVSIDQTTPGPAPVAAAIDMPDVEGQTIATALATLAEQGLVIERVDVIYGPGPINQVVEQNPTAGEPIDERETVTLVVRTGR
jgi:eukaryotic-like serine/threonine-protein kinase